jgi:DNA-binding CsgD family transcriptional regulator
MSAAEMRPIIGIDAAAVRLTDILLGYDDNDLAESLRGIAADIGVKHISYFRFSTDKSMDTILLTAVVTYSLEWQHRYFMKQYFQADPVIAQGVRALMPFDWEELEITPAAAAFFADARYHGVGRRGVSIPVRNRRNSCAVVSLSSDRDKEEWEAFKHDNMVKLQLLSALIDSAAGMNGKLPAAPVKLSKREEQCLLWAARGKTYQEIAEILGISFGSVKTHLDTARHKLHCLNLTHAVAVAIATEVIPAKALKW